MDLQIVTPHNAKAIRHRCRIPVYPRYWGTLQVSVAEISREDAPVATRRKASDSDIAVGENVETRWFDGSHWLPRILRLNSGPLLVDEALLVDHVRTKNSFMNPFVLEKGVNYVSNALDPHGELYRLVEDDGSETAMEKASEVVRDMLLIDGQVWQRVHEPVYRIDVATSSDRRLSISHITSPKTVAEILDPSLKTWERRGPKIDHAELFAADQVDQMLAYYQLYKDADEVPELRSDQLLEILIPESIQLDIDHLVVKERVQGILRDTVMMHRWPDEQIEAWMAVRREYQGRLEGQIQADSDLGCLITAMREFAELKSGHPGRDIIAAADRWDFRPIEFEFPVDFAPVSSRF
ncbi:hypothetical protein [Roseibium sp. RKSG952]|uniref:hypothetical protein n=1 Tax=Roseibium sp. RKSG952 TaxID=2529384 RepID=UPI0012BB7758|nr:hypothetical protein [Roseibium sp. RKSG952]MTH94763.1 hypothetical protein [Roseibium sp. RKSG952]